MKLSYLLLLLLTFLLPVQLGYHFWPDFTFVYGVKIDYLSPTIFLTDLLLLFFLTSFIVERKIYRKKIKVFTTVSDKIFFLLFILIAATTTSLALFPLLSLIKTVRFLFLIIFALILKNNFFKTRWIIIALTAACFYSSLLALVQVLVQSSLNGPLWFLGERSLSLSTAGVAKAVVDGRLFFRPYGSFSHPNSLAGFLLAALFLILEALKKTKTTSKRQIYQLVLSLIIMVLFLTFSRVCWLIFLLLFPLGLFYYHRRQKGSRFFYLIPLLLVPVAGIYFLKELPFSTALSLSQRLELNKTAIELFKQNFFFGVGFNNFLKLLPFFPTGKVFLIQPVHNIYLLVLSESGIFGGLFFLSLFWVVLKKVIIGKRFFLLLSLLVILISGFLDHYWLTLPQNLLLLALIFGIGLNNQENVKI